MTVYVSSMMLRSMRLTGEKARGATLTSDEQVEVLAELNAFMESSSLEGLMCYQLTQESFALSASTATYTIGPSATFNTVRPTKLMDPCFIRDAGNLDSQLKILGPDTYGRIVQKNAGVTYPEYIFYDKGFTSSGAGTINLYPSPSGSLTLYINSQKQLGSFSTVSQPLNLPIGYQLYIESNFAMQLAAGFIQASPELVRMARDSKANVKSMNLPEPIMRLDAGIVRGTRSNIFTG